MSFAWSRLVSRSVSRSVKIGKEIKFILCHSQVRLGKVAFYGNYYSNNLPSIKMTYGKMGIRDKDHSLPLAVLPVALSATNKTNSRNSRNIYMNFLFAQVKYM